MKPFQAQTYYELLEVSVSASAEEIRGAYERLNRLYSDDQVALYGLIDASQCEALRGKLKEAFDVLADEPRRETGNCRVILNAYAVLDGFDLGVGILLPLAPRHEHDPMVASIGPFWDANETWLVLGVGILLVAFPHAYGVILSSLYLPVAVMLLAGVLTAVLTVAGIAANVGMGWVSDRLGHRLVMEVGALAATASVLLAWLAVNLFLGSQLSWICRPFIGSPGLPVEFLRAHAFEGNFYESVFRAVLRLLHG